MSSDIGLLVDDVEHVELTLTLRSFHPTKGNVLQLYTERHSHALLVNNYKVEPGKAVVVSFHKEKGAGRLMVGWFVDDVDEEGLVAQEAIGSGFYHRKETVDLLDIEGQPHGSVRIQGWSDTSWTAPNMHAALGWSKMVADAHKALHAHYDDTFTDTNVFLDRVRALPLIWYTLHATLIQAQPEPTTRLLDHWLSLAVRFAHPSQRDDECMLADMISIMSQIGRAHV